MSGHANRQTEKFLMRIVLAVLLILFALPVNASELRITVEGIRSPHGTILIGLYDSLESFTRAIELSDKDGSSMIQTGLPQSL
jgi:uncharacterized protein (DUF2141 family)